MDINKHTDYSPSIPNILQYGSELKEVNLTIARQFDYTDPTSDASDFFKKSGLQLIRDIVLKHLGRDEIRSCFFEYSTLCSSIDSNTLSAFLCLWQRENCLDPSNLAGKLDSVISKLFKAKLSLYYLPEFFIQPKEDKANITTLPGFKFSSFYKDIEERFNTYLKKYREVENNKTNENYKPLVEIDKDTFVQNLSLSNVSYPKVINDSRSFHKEDVLPNHLLLHHLYDEVLFPNKLEGDNTTLISIPMLGAPIFGDKSHFNGQGAVFIYLITSGKIERSSVERLVSSISNVSRDITYNYLFEVGYKKAQEAIAMAEDAKKSAIKSAIIQYMARNLSHNTGSHLIPEAIVYFQKQLEGTDDDSSKQLREEFTYYQKYTQERMELLAQLSSMKNNHNFTNYDLCEIVEEFQDSVIPKGLCDDLNKNLKGISITTKWDKIKPSVALPDGAVGKQAFYIILENFIRNAYKHSVPKIISRQKKYLFEISISEPPNTVDLGDFWCIDIYDKLGEENIEKRSDKMLLELKSLIKDSVLTNGELRERGWGILEMKSAAAFLSEKPLDQLDDLPTEYFQANYYDDTGLIESKLNKRNLGHRFYLAKPKLLIIDADIATQAQRQQTAHLRSKGIVVCNIDADLIKKAPYLFIITKKEIGFTNQKILTENIDTSSDIVTIENTLWDNYLFQNNWHKINIIASNEVNFTETTDKLFFDSHGQTLKIKNGGDLRNADISEILDLGLPYYHPFKSRSRIQDLLVSANESRFRGLLLEGVFNRVLIIDERIQNSVNSEDRDQSNLSIKDIFSLIGIDIPNQNLSDYLEKPDANIAQELLALIKDDRYKYVILHLTILEKLSGKTKKSELREYIDSRGGIGEYDNFDKKGKAFILVSGRGQPPNLPDHSFYMNYTTLYDCVMYRMSKPHLMQTLVTLRK